jgi:hypothetical protein
MKVPVLSNLIQTVHVIHSNKVLADKYRSQSHYSVKIVDFRSAASLPENLIGSRLFGIRHGGAQLRKTPSWIVS